MEIHMASRAQNSGGTVKASKGFYEAVVDNKPAGRASVNGFARQEREGAKNPGTTTTIPDLGQSNRRSFEEQLKEIDKEMGFLNENLGDLKVQENFPCLSDTVSKDSAITGSINLSPGLGDRLPFKDISNSNPMTTPGKSTKVRVGSWKKKVRAKNNGPERIEVVLSEKSSL
jgi:hypothetical protein